jgi:hypothetical protein
METRLCTRASAAVRKRPARGGTARVQCTCVLARVKGGGRAPGGGGGGAGRGGAKALRLRARGGRAHQQRGDAERHEGQHAGHGYDGRDTRRSGGAGQSKNEG